MMRRIATMLLLAPALVDPMGATAGAVAPASCFTPAPHGFSDVPFGTAHNTAVAWLVEAGITTGTAPGVYSPNTTVDRAQMATFLWHDACGTSETTSIAAGINHTCAVRDPGTATCWGHNGDGQLGNGTTGSYSTPTAVSGL